MLFAASRQRQMKGKLGGQSQWLDGLFGSVRGQIVVALQIEPELRCCAKSASEQPGCFRSNASLATN